MQIHVLSTTSFFKFCVIMTGSMPFKTRKKKQAAIKHRVAVSVNGAVSYTGFVEKGQSPKSPDKGALRHMEELDSELNLPGFKKEIIKIVLLATLIIGFQLALKFSNLTFLK